jgi:hypothetical protein
VNTWLAEASWSPLDGRIATDVIGAGSSPDAAEGLPEFILSRTSVCEGRSECLFVDVRVADWSGQPVAVAVRVEADLVLGDAVADVVGSVGVGLDAEQRVYRALAAARSLTGTMIVLIP